jgi:DNA repair protein RecO (recombination protein O)
MEWTDRGIVLAARRHGESSAIVTALTAGHGRHAGLVRGARRAAGTFEPGNLVALRWRARLDEHLGNYTAELAHSHAAALLDDPLRLSALAAACALVDAALPERERHGRVFESLAGLLALLESGADAEWQAAFVRFEIDLLRDLGFGLDLAQCAATGQIDALAFVSPKTGRAVSQAAGEPYRGKLLALPSFLTAANVAPAPDEIAQGLRLTGYFLERHVFAPHGHTIPPARARLVDRIAAIGSVAPAKGEG